MPSLYGITSIVHFAVILDGFLMHRDIDVTAQFLPIQICVLSAVIPASLPAFRFEGHPSFCFFFPTFKIATNTLRPPRHSNPEPPHAEPQAESQRTEIASFSLPPRSLLQTPLPPAGRDLEGALALLIAWLWASGSLRAEGGPCGPSASLIRGTAVLQGCNQTPPHSLPCAPPPRRSCTDTSGTHSQKSCNAQGTSESSCHRFRHPPQPLCRGPPTSQSKSKPSWCPPP